MPQPTTAGGRWLSLRAPDESVFGSHDLADGGDPAPFYGPTYFAMTPTTEPAQSMIKTRVRLSDRDPFHPGQTGVVESYHDHYLAVLLDDTTRTFGPRTTVHERSVTTLRRAVPESDDDGQ